MDSTERSIRDILEHRNRIMIFEDPDDGTIFVNAWTADENDQVIPGSLVVNYSPTMWGALGYVQGDLMESN